MWIELKSPYWSSIVDLGGTYTPSPHFLLLRGILGDDFTSAPQSYRTILHTTCNDSLFVKLVDPV